jgi:formylglycine-generating enzyme required for sulfatase activity
MNNGKVRIYELSRELNLDNRDILAICDQLNITDKSHSSTISEAEAARIRSAAVKEDTPSLPLRRTPRKGQGYIEPLLKVVSALPLHMVFIPRGTFKMGSPQGEPEREDSESPQRDVTVPPFFMGRYPVTQAQWCFVAGLSPVKQNLDPEPSHFNEKDNYPVERVSWYDAVEFCARLGTHTSRPYRLPTEAEWEYACKAGTMTPFYFGKTLNSELANYDASVVYNNGSTGQYRLKTTTVDSFGIANAFGLSDMHGNVWEWCLDYWHDNYEGAPADGSAWLTENENSNRVNRGGSWYSDPGNCHSACRSNSDPGNRA